MAATKKKRKDEEGAQTTPSTPPAPSSSSSSPPRWKRLAVPVGVFAVSAAVYVAMLGDRMLAPSSDNHFVHLAMSFLHGQLSSLNGYHTDNDWALYDGRWYVSFPPLPAILILPVVAIWKERTYDRLFWAIFSGLGPAFVYLVLRELRESGRSLRTVRNDLFLTALFAFGTVYFFTAVQGTVWFAAQVVSVVLLALYLLFALDAKRPFWAGLMIALAFLTRPPNNALAVIFFGLEALRVSRRDDAPVAPEDALVWRRVWVWLRGVNWVAFAKRAAPFAAPILVAGAIAMWMNDARYGHPFEFGHRYLQIRWLGRIEKWGLFNYHYLSKNLAVFCAGLPWLSATRPYVMISRHGLALWFTTPALLLVLFPKKVTPTMVALYVTAAAICVLDLMYQNSGWVQFGYRFALDYMVFLFALLALGGRRFGPGFCVLLAFAIAVNTFGAITFDRAWQFYDGDATQNVLFQPD